MAIVTVRWSTCLMWTCQGCGAQFPMAGPEDDTNNTEVAVAHERSCGHDVRAGAHPGWLVYEVEPPHGSG